MSQTAPYAIVEVASSQWEVRYTRTVMHVQIFILLLELLHCRMFL